MNNEINMLVQKFSSEIQELFTNVREIIIECTSKKVEEKLWARIPSYYVVDNFIRIIPFKDHINIEAAAISRYKLQLEQYKITPKGMLQIYVNQNIPYSVLKMAFAETLST